MAKKPYEPPFRNLGLSGLARRIVEAEPPGGYKVGDKVTIAKRGPKKGNGGGPRKGEEARTLRQTKPWEAEGISARTWYRRQKEGGK